MKKLALLLTIALLIGLFTGCQSSSGNPDVTEDSKQKTETDATEGYPSGILYYSTDNGYDIFFSPNGLFASHKEAIAGEAFGYASGFDLFAYKGGKKMLLKDAYEAGLVTKEDIAAARDFHNQRISFTEYIADCRPEPIFRMIQTTIEEGWVDAGNETFGTWYSNDNPEGDWRYYIGNVMFFCGGEQENIFTTIEINGVTFSHPTTFQLYKVSETSGTFTDLQEYCKQTNDYSGLQLAAQQHKQLQDALYGEGWDS